MQEKGSIFKNAFSICNENTTWNAFVRLPTATLKSRPSTPVTRTHHCSSWISTTTSSTSITQPHVCLNYNLLDRDAHIQHCYLVQVIASNLKTWMCGTSTTSSQPSIWFQSRRKARTVLNAATTLQCTDRKREEITTKLSSTFDAFFVCIIQPCFIFQVKTMGSFSVQQDLDYESHNY